MSTPIVFPPIQGGIYHISSLVSQLFLELQRDGSLRATRPNDFSDVQKWTITPDDDGTYKIACLQGNYDLPCETYSAHRNSLGYPQRQLWTIDPRGVSFIIANAQDFRVLDLFPDGLVGFSERNNASGQRWVIHLVRPSDHTAAPRTHIQPYFSPGIASQPEPKPYDVRIAEPPKVPKPCNKISPLRVRKTPISQGAVREGVYRIVSAIRTNDSVGFLELQTDGSIKIAALNDANDGQKWTLTYYQNSQYYIKSTVDSRALALQPSASDPNVSVPVGDNSFPIPWTIEPRHDTYFIGVAEGERVLDVTANNVVVSENLNGCTTQRWDLDPVKVNCQPVFRDGIRYLIRNSSSGSVIWLKGHNDFVVYGHDDNDVSLQFTFKNQADGGTAIYSQGHQIWAAAELKTSTAEHSYRFIPTEVGSKYYYISTEMISNPPKVLQDSGGLGLGVLFEGNAKQMWELVPKMV